MIRAGIFQIAILRSNQHVSLEDPHNPFSKSHGHPNYNPLRLSWRGVSVTGRAWRIIGDWQFGTDANLPCIQ